MYTRYDYNSFTVYKMVGYVVPRVVMNNICPEFLKKEEEVFKKLTMRVVLNRWFQFIKLNIRVICPLTKFSISVLHLIEL